MKEGRYVKKKKEDEREVAEINRGERGRAEYGVSQYLFSKGHS